MSTGRSRLPPSYRRPVGSLAGPGVRRSRLRGRCRPPDARPVVRPHRPRPPGSRSAPPAACSASTRTRSGAGRTRAGSTPSRPPAATAGSTGATLERILEAGGHDCDRPLATLGATPERLSRAYRRGYANGAAGRRRPDGDPRRRSRAPSATAAGASSRRSSPTSTPTDDGRRATAAEAEAVDATRRPRPPARRRRHPASTEAVSLFVAARRPFLPSSAGDRAAAGRSTRTGSARSTTSSRPSSTASCSGSSRPTRRRAALIGCRRVVLPGADRRSSPSSFARRAARPVARAARRLPAHLGDRDAVLRHRAPAARRSAARERLERAALPDVVPDRRGLDGRLARPRDGVPAGPDAVRLHASPLCLFLAGLFTLLIRNKPELRRRRARCRSSTSSPRRSSRSRSPSRPTSRTTAGRCSPRAPSSGATVLSLVLMADDDAARARATSSIRRPASRPATLFPRTLRLLTPFLNITGALRAHPRRALLGVRVHAEAARPGLLAGPEPARRPVPVQPPDRARRDRRELRRVAARRDRGRCSPGRIHSRVPATILIAIGALLASDRRRPEPVRRRPSSSRSGSSSASSSCSPGSSSRSRPSARSGSRSRSIVLGRTRQESPARASWRPPEPSDRAEPARRRAPAATGRRGRRPTMAGCAASRARTIAPVARPPDPSSASLIVIVAGERFRDPRTARPVRLRRRVRAARRSSPGGPRSGSWPRSRRRRRRVRRGGIPLVNPLAGSPGDAPARARRRRRSMGFALNVAMFFAFDLTTIALALLGFYTYPAFVAVVAAAARSRAARPAADRRPRAGPRRDGPRRRGQLDPAAGIRFHPLGVLLGLVRGAEPDRLRHGQPRPLHDGPARAGDGRACSRSPRVGAPVSLAVATGGVARRSRSATPSRPGARWRSPASSPRGSRRCCFLTGIRAIGGTRAGILMLFEPLVGVTLAAALLDEALAPIQVVGGARDPRRGDPPPARRRRGASSRRVRRPMRSPTTDRVGDGRTRPGR